MYNDNGSLTLNANGTISAGSNVIQDVSTPVSGMDAANKIYADTKEPSIASGTTAQYWRGDKSWQTLNSSAVGLGNVDNTSDANKPVSSATQTALNLKLNSNDASVTNSRRLRFVGSTTQALCASTGTDEVLYAVLLETLAVGDIIEFFCQMTCTSSANSKVYKAWLNTTANLSGSPVQIAQLTVTTNLAAATFQRRYGVRSSTSLVSAYAAATSFVNPYANSTALPTTITSLPDMTTTCYIIISANRANSGDTVGAEWFMVRTNRV
jgi:hypothetical protein